MSGRCPRRRERRGSRRAFRIGVALACLVFALRCASGQEAQGQVTGTRFVHSAESARALILKAQVAVPAQVLGPEALLLPLAELPKISGGARHRVPVVIFLHDAAGLSSPAVAQWQRWLASEGIASVATDSMVLPERITYTSPVGKDVYEKIHALRASEIELALAAVRDWPWADLTRVVLAGSGEGAVAVARYAGHYVAARLIFDWSCEDNYFVAEHRTAVGIDPVLNLASATESRFSRSNPWLGNPDASGNCANALRNNPAAAVVLLPGDPETLFDAPQARVLTLAWLKNALAF